jgi:predicted permease
MLSPRSRWPSVDPHNAPFLPTSQVGMVARFTFHTFTIPLIYGTIATAVTVESVGNYWSLIAGSWVVLAVSYVVATLLHRWFLPIANRRDFVALRVAVAFPNIVSLPILIFPSLCEFPVMYEGYAVGGPSSGDNSDAGTDAENDSADLRRECVAQSTTMIFCYFFAWSLAFWSFGNPQLLNAATTLSSPTQRDTVDGNTTAADDEEDDVAGRTAPCCDQDGCPSVGTTGSLVEGQGENCDGKEETKAKDRIRLSDDHHETFVGGEFHSKDNTITCSEDKSAVALIEGHCDTSMSPSNHQVELFGQRDALEVLSKSQQTSSSSPDKGEEDPQVLESPSVIIENINPTSSPMKQLIMSLRPVLGSVWTAVQMTVTSPGFIAMMLAFLTACIPPLQRSLFQPGGALRFLGSALETLGTASAPISTMVVAASLVPPTPLSLQQESRREEDENEEGGSRPVIDERPGMTDPNFGPYQRRRRRRTSSQLVRQLGRSMRSSSVRMLQAMPRSTPEMRRIHLWFNLSRLILTPALVVGIVLAMDCTGSFGTLASVPDLAKLVIIVNSALPGALIIVVILKSKEELADTAAAVSRAYLPNYLLSIVTIAAWTGVGLWVTLPNEDGNTFCQQ